MRAKNQQTKPIIRAAAANEAVAISALAMRSKAYWGYSDEFMKACRPDLTYTAAQIDSGDYEFGVCEVGDRLAGFYALEFHGVRDAELDALFVEPEFIGRGIGRMLMDDAKKKSADSGIKQLIIQGDPHAVRFYEAAGGIHSGQRESASIPGRFLPLFRIDL